MNRAFSEKVARTLNTHLVTITYLRVPPEGRPGQRGIISGFVIDVAGEWFYITAGHTIRAVRESVQIGWIYREWRFGDHTTSNKSHGAPVPHYFDENDWLWLDDKSTGLDYAVMPMTGLLKTNLVAGDVQPIDKNSRGEIDKPYDRYLLVGIPGETFAQGPTLLTAETQMIPFHPCEAPHNALDPSPYKFHGKLEFDAHISPNLKDIAGMSGGPVFGVKTIDDVMRYWAIGVQSAWYPSSSIIAVCSLTTFANALEKSLTATRSEPASPGN